MKRGLWLAFALLPAVAAAWEEEPAIAFILAYNPVVTAQRQAVNRHAKLTRLSG